MATRAVELPSVGFDRFTGPLPVARATYRRELAHLYAPNPFSHKDYRDSLPLPMTYRLSTVGNAKHLPTDLSL